MKPTANPALIDAVLACITERRRRFVIEATGEIFEGITETDLAHELRDRRWRLPRGWLSEVEGAGFHVRQVQNFKGGAVRTHFDEAPTINPDTGRPFKYDSFQRRLLGAYVTLVSL